jgi:hypothetical protein
MERGFLATRITSGRRAGDKHYGRQDPRKCWYLTATVHRVTKQNTSTRKFIAVKTSNPASITYLDIKCYDLQRFELAPAIDAMAL